MMQPPSVVLLIISASNTVTLSESSEISSVMLLHVTSCSFHSGAKVFLIVFVLVLRAFLVLFLFQSKRVLRLHTDRLCHPAAARTSVAPTSDSKLWPMPYALAKGGSAALLG